jgi:NAD(P)-dependent dehydrogenase (short-subunit alcohol dehydrogenase family)
MLGAKAAFDAMRETGGWVWFVEGHGSDGRIMAGLSAYGAAKRGLSYLWRALVAEAATAEAATAEAATAEAATAAAVPRIKVGAVSPGIMVTDFVMDSLASQEGERRRKTVAVFNILADKPETVAAFLVPRMLSASRSGTRIAWLTGAKVMARFLAAPFSRRRLIEG